MESILEKYKKIGSYREEDVKFLLKDLSHIELEGSTETREKRIQSGEHYSESLPVEYYPPDEYLQLFHQTLTEHKKAIALQVGIVAEQILMKNGKASVLVSLARAGTPVGILLKRYIKWKFGMTLPHYSISIIRGRGIDLNAIHYILEKHPEGSIQFIDGWTGKGAISLELTKSVEELRTKYGIVLDDTLAVLADPGHCTTLFGTRDDLLIPSACLNSTVSGLVSRTVLNKKYIGPDDFHGAKYYRELENYDLSNEYLDVIEKEFSLVSDEAARQAEINGNAKPEVSFAGMKTVERIQKDYGIESMHFVKPGVGETTRVLLRRVPWKILIKDWESPYVKHILMLCEDKKVEVELYPNMEYTCCGLIKNVSETS